MTVLGLIPARGGSKRLPGKNIKKFGDKPLIAHTICAGLACKEISRLIVSTEDEKIAAVARAWGAEVPFIRPPQLATDEASSLEVVKHALEFVEQERFFPEYIVLLQPTSPLRESEDISLALQEMRKGQWDLVISLCASNIHPYWYKTIAVTGEVKPFFDYQGSLRSQDLAPAFRPNGAIYIYRSEFIRRGKSPVRIGAYIMEDWKSIDIDTALDFFLAEKIWEHRGIFKGMSKSGG
ncbi:cytidylyltransferase domain-containing protein [Carboxydocella sp. JDF658]|uniref:acylneuraminate cytidylyltransferase family protein n=1 Tax=Carboxydocella sp. JDF658 TaxID=1926600 RepID=UPI00135672E5|nr:acylneuraminate cytidylyltransferase family protein [Carboxydocella sp. JDF658]